MTKIAFSLLALVAAPTFAQTDPTQPTTDAAGDTIIVTATRSGTALPADLLGASVTVVDAVALDRRQTRIVSDVLRDVPGVAVSRVGAVGGLTQVRLRGAEANQTLVLIDGIKASDPYYGEFDFGTLLADEAARVEVLRGQQSALYGSDAIGGVINYITLTGAEAPGFRLRAEGGSMGTAGGGVRQAGVSGPLDYAVAASGLHTNGYPTAIGGTRNVGSDSASASAKATWTPAPIFKLTAIARVNLTAADTNNSDNNFGSSTYGLTIDSPGVRFRHRAFYGLLRAQLDTGRFTSVVSGQVADTTRDGYDVADPNAPSRGQAIVRASGDHGARLKGSYEGTFRFGTDYVRHSLTAAVDHEDESERTTVSQYGAFLGVRHTVDTGVVGEYEVTAFDRLGVGASLRHDFNTRFADATTYRVQASYKAGDTTRLHAASGSGIRNPTFSQLFDYYAGRYVGNAGLKPERSTGYEAGIAQAVGPVTVDATYFDNRRHNEITTVYDANFVGHPVNLPGSTRQSGVEVALAAPLTGGWRIDASYTHLAAPQSRQVTFNAATGTTGTFIGQAVRRAADIASANLTYAPAAAPYSATVTVRYNGPQKDIFFGFYPPLLVTLPAFTLVNLNATYAVAPHLELFGRIENLLDRGYVEVVSFATPGRAAYGGVRVRL